MFLTANLGEYAPLIARIVPNRFHPWVTSKIEGREPEDVFPIAYRTNTRGAVGRLAKQAGFEIVAFNYLGQYPSYFMFNGFLFLLGTAYEKTIASATRSESSAGVDPGEAGCESHRIVDCRQMSRGWGGWEQR